MKNSDLDEQSVIIHIIHPYDQIKKRYHEKIILFFILSYP